MIHVGSETVAAGRTGDKPATALANTLARVGFRVGRLKTGTPPRIARDSIALAAMPEERGDSAPRAFSYLNRRSAVDASDQARPRPPLLPPPRHARCHAGPLCGGACALCLAPACRRGRMARGVPAGEAACCCGPPRAPPRPA